MTLLNILLWCQFKRYTKINKRFIKREPWITSGLLTSCRTKVKLPKKKLNKPTELNLIAYKNFLHHYNKLKRIMKQNYYQSMLEINKSNMKKTWEFLKKAIGNQNDKTSIPQMMKINNEQVSENTQIADSFNTYLASIGATTGQNVPISKSTYTDFLQKPIANSMYIEPVEPYQVTEVVKKLKPKNSSGHDEISTKLVKNTISNIILPLTHIINISLQNGIVPDQLKIAKVIPVYKSSDADQIKNYRPISLLPAFSKIFEKIMYNKIMSFLDSKNILYKHQYCFRPKHSTIHPILHLLDDCATNNNRIPKNYTMTILCDLSKAFDVINHKILLKKLNFYGIRGTAGKWLESYLTNRKQFVEIKDAKSKTLGIECGVPQGSILGPLLYLLYVNDICFASDCNILSFADDTSLYLADSNLAKLFKKANEEVNKLYDWFCSNKLSLNPTKTKFIVIKASNTLQDTSGLKLCIANTPLT